MNENVKNILTGMFLGVIGLALGVVLMILLYKTLTNVSLDFIKENYDLIWSSGPMQMATGCLLINFILFYLYMRKQKYLHAQGVMISCILVIIFSLIS